MTLKEFFEKHDTVALAFSGGVDSSYLLEEGIRYAKKIKAYYVKSQFQPQFELDDAMKLAEQLGADMEIIHVDALSPEVAANPENRCYYCKQNIFGTIIEHAKADGFTEILDGTNASDEAGDRPGMKALQEMKVLSPLRECGLTKPEIREKSKEAGLFTWNKPAYACLATRVPAGITITNETLEKVEAAEGKLFDMGFTDFRVRVYHDAARIQMPEAQMAEALTKRNEILAALKPYFKAVMLDLECR